MSDTDQSPGHDADASVRFALSPDGLSLGISRYTPATGAGKPLTAESLCAQLKEAGVVDEPVPGACEKIVRYLEEGKDITKTALVRGTPAQEPRDAALDPEGDLNFPVFAGQVCALYTPALTAAKGLTIDGRVLEPKKTNKPKDLKAKTGENCDFNQETGAFTAQVYGLASIVDNLVSVRPLLAVAEDKIAVLAGIHFQDNLGRPVTLELLVPELDKLKVALKPREKTLAKALEQAKETGKLVSKVPLVKGKAPVPGKDGWIEFKVEMPRAAGTVDDQGRIDWRDKGGHASVAPNTLIAVLHPPEPGQGGIDVYAKSLPPAEGKSLTVVPGENVELVGESTFKATATGLVVHDRNVLSVTDCLTVPEDVDVSTGNIHVDMGSVRINGNVQTGFKVAAPDHVVVGDTVENAVIEAGKDVEVKNGILMAEEGGLVKAGGTVQAGFATGARIEAKGDVTFNGEVINCRITTKGAVAALGNSAVVSGGEIRAPKGFEAHELGSDLGVATVVEVPWDGDENQAMVKKRGEITEKIKKIDEILGPGEDEDILLNAPTDKQHLIGNMIEVRGRLHKARASLKEAIAKDTAKRREEISRVRIRVRGTIHPGVIIKFAGKIMEIKQPLERSQFAYDPVERELVVKDY